MRSAFLTVLRTVPAADLRPPFHRLCEPLRYFSAMSGHAIEVPRGFPTDFASCRIGDLELRGKTDRPAVVHDWLYAQGIRGKVACDLVFYEACRAEGLGVFRSGLRFAAVLAAPAAHKAWRAHRRGNTPGARFCAALLTAPDPITNHP